MISDISLRNLNVPGSLIVVAATVLVMVAMPVLFGELSVSFGFLLWNLVVVVFFVLCFQMFRSLVNLRGKTQFQYVVFFISLAIRAIVMILLYIIFYDITGTSFDVEAIDALFYHDTGLEVASQIGKGQIDLYALSRGGHYKIEDMGYGIFLGFVYFLSDNSIIIARFIQCVLDSLSVIFIYKIVAAVWDEKTGRLAAILSMLFPMQILYVSLHLKETLMIFCLLAGTLAVYRLSERIRFTSIFILLFSVVALASMRSAVLIIFVAAMLIFFFFNKSKGLIYKTMVVTLVTFLLVLSLTQFGLHKQAYSKVLRLVGLDENTSLGGQSLQLLANRGQSLAAKISLPVLGIPALQTPFPSMVRTNIVHFNQTMQWYQIGALFVWGYLAFFGFYGLVYSIRHCFFESLFLLTMLIGYTVALVYSAYIMSIRYNIIKLVFFLPFIAVGMKELPKKKLWLWYLYCGFFAVIVVLWNYVKLYGRGLI